MITRIDEFRKYLASNEGRQPAQTYVVRCKDPEGEIKSIVEYIGKIGNTGHSFTIVAGDKKFYWDGDGGDFIDTVEQTVGGYTITCRDVESELLGLLNALSKITSEVMITVDPNEDDEKEFIWSGKVTIESITSNDEKVDEKLSKEAQAFISDKIKTLIEEGRPAPQAKAIAYSMAKKAGFKIPKRKKKTNESVLSVMAITAAGLLFLKGLMKKVADIRLPKKWLNILNTNDKLKVKIDEFDDKYLIEIGTDIDGHYNMLFEMQLMTNGKLILPGGMICDLNEKQYEEFMKFVHEHDK